MGANGYLLNSGRLYGLAIGGNGAQETFCCVGILSIENLWFQRGTGEWETSEANATKPCGSALICSLSGRISQLSKKCGPTRRNSS